jgi:hypothetical protein
MYCTELKMWYVLYRIRDVVLILDPYKSILYHAIENTANQNSGKWLYILQYPTQPYQEVISATFLLYEIKDRQDSECSESGYVSKPVEFHEEQVKVCHYYNSNSTYKFCKELYEEARSSGGESVINTFPLQDALQKLHSVKLPRFRYKLIKTLILCVILITIQKLYTLKFRL